MRLASELKPDVITMDVEMPVMNGIQAVSEIMRSNPTPILMFSSLTAKGAQATLDALDAGAMDFMPKCFNDMLKNKDDVYSALVKRLKILARAKYQFASSSSTVSSNTNSANATNATSSINSSNNNLASPKKTLVNPSSNTQTNTSIYSTTREINRTGVVDKAFDENQRRIEELRSMLAKRKANNLTTAINAINKTSSFTTNSGSAVNVVSKVVGSDATTATTVTHEYIKEETHVPESVGKAKVLGNNQYNNRYSLLAIGSSTGGPVAVQNILIKLPKDFPVPIVLVQHMPAAFTGPFADRLNRICAIEVSEAVDGEELKPGHAYIAPGGKQLIVEKGSGKNLIVSIIETPAGVNYKPCVDITFGSIAKLLKDKVHANILTGMGADGKMGCCLLHEQGSTVFAQDEETCVIYGMPKAVVDAGVADKVLPIDEMAENIVNMFLK